jgi:SAM-dependent methyltransferase
MKDEKIGEERLENQGRTRVGQLAREFLQRDDATGWFEALYAQAHFDSQTIPWADMVGNPNLIQWLERQNVQGQGQRALVVGCGLGDDAEELAQRSFEVVAFDIAPTAIDWCKKRFPDSRVTYTVADVLDAPSAWKGNFDFVVEAYTLQALPPHVRKQAITGIAGLVAKKGTLMVICRGRSPEEHPGNLPWPLTKEELDLFLDTGLRQWQFEDYLDLEEPPKRRFRVAYRRDT